jgi:hypothetical protein
MRVGRCVSVSVSALNDALDLLSGLVLENGRRWGECAVSVQWEDAKAVLDPASPTPYNYLTRARGFSKTGDLAGDNIAVLLTQAPPRARLYALAADANQAGLLLDAIGGYVARTPELAGALTLQEQKVIATRSGASLQVLPADAASVWGLKPFFSTIDELSAWHETPRTQRVFEAVTTGAAKVPGSRIVVLCTAGDPGHFSRKVLDHAYADDLWRVHEVPGLVPWMDPKRIKGEGRRLPESSYRRLFLNEWVESEDRLAGEDDLAACVVLDGPQEPKAGVRYVIGVDLGLKSDATDACVCHSERIPGTDTPRIVLDRMGVWKGSRLKPVQLGRVEEWVEEVSRRYGRATVRFDPYQAVHMDQRLKKTGISVDEFTFGPASVGKLATLMLQLIGEHSIALPDDPDLLNELRTVRVKESSPGVFRMDHDRGRHDDRVISLALAASWLVERATSGSEIYVSHPFRTGLQRTTRTAPAGTQVSGTTLSQGRAATPSRCRLRSPSRAEPLFPVGTR